MIMKNSMSPEDYNSIACDLANDYAQARLEMCAEDFQEWEEWIAERLSPVRSNTYGICCYCGSDKEPNVDYDVEKEDYVFAGTYVDCECRSIVNECRDTRDDDDLPF